MSAARQVPLIVILILSGSPAEMRYLGGLGPLVANSFNTLTLCLGEDVQFLRHSGSPSEISRY
jgi:hypothetical protein